MTDQSPKPKLMNAYWMGEEHKTYYEHLLELYAQEQAHTDDRLEKILSDLQAFVNGDMEISVIDDIIEELEIWSAGRQARDTWGDAWEAEQERWNGPSFLED